MLVHSFKVIWLSCLGHVGRLTTGKTQVKAKLLIHGS